MTTYNYENAMYDDVKDYIDNNINIADYEDADSLAEYLHDTLWAGDSVTGNASGSY